MFKLKHLGLALTLPALALLAVNVDADSRALQKKSVATKTAIQPVAKQTAKRARIPAAAHPKKVEKSSKLTLSGKLKLPAQFKQRAPKRLAGDADSKPVYAMMGYSDEWDESGIEYGVYSIATDGSGSYSQIEYCYFAPNGGGVMTPDAYYCTSYSYDDYFGLTSLQHYKLDPETFEIETIWWSESFETIATDEAYDYTTGNIYGCFYTEDGSGFEFAKRDYEQGTVTKICDLDNLWHACDFDKDGNLYAIDLDGNLMKVDKQTGASTTIGNIGVKSDYLTSGCINYKTGEFIFATCGYDLSSLYAVNTTTAQASLINDFNYGEEFCGMYLPRTTEEKAPAAPQNVQLNYVENQLAGTLSFDVPATTFDGEAASGAVDYSITQEGETIASGTTSYGATNVEVQLPAVEKSGTYKFILFLQNEAGVSPSVTLTKYIGDDRPQDVYDVRVSYADGVAHLSWEPVTESFNGGYINFENLKYIVTSYPSGAEYTLDYGTNEFDEPIAEPESLTKFYYTVRVSYMGEEGEAVESNAIVLGTIIPPYECDFESEDEFLPYTIIDANEDGITWYLEADNSVARAPYSGEYDMDDWLILPAAKFEAGQLYQFTISIRNTTDFFPERYEVKMGTAPNVESMTEQLIEPTELTSAAFANKTASISVEQSGVYYIGVHGISDADQFFLDLDKVSISEGVSTLAPAAVSNFVVTPSFDGLAEAAISFTTPDKNIGGEQLSSLDKVEIYRDDELIHTISNPALNTAFSWTDTETTKGDKKYSVVCYNEYGKGESVFANVYIGVYIPSVPTNIKAVETDTPGEVTITWDAPETDVNGNPINPALITYTVINYRQSVLVEDYTDTALTIQAIDEDAEQEFAQFGVVAQTEAGLGEFGISDMIAIGKAYDMPMVDSFYDTSITYNWGTSGYWNIGEDSDFTDLDSSDNDNGFAYFTGDEIGTVGSFFSGKVHISGENPVLSFMYFPIESSVNPLNVYAISKGNSTLLQTIVSINDFPDASGWKRVIIPLDQFQGQDIQVSFEAECVSHTFLFIDNIGVINLLPYNLEVNGIQAPETVDLDEDVEISVDILNCGANALDEGEYTVNLYRNGELAETAQGPALQSAASTSVKFHQSFNATSEEVNEFYATVVCDKDTDSDNNQSDTISVTLLMPQYPTVSNLEAKIEGNDVALSWDAPNMDELPLESSVESFEDANQWDQSYGDWTFVDNDGNAAGSIYGASFPYEGEAISWFCIDSTHDGTSEEEFEAHSGDKYLSTMYVTGGDYTNDDWLISPQLAGGAQNISFYAKSYSWWYFETFQVLYSTSDTELDSFVEIATVADIPNEWTKYSYYLPNGAKYFAIRCISEDKLMMFVDDVEFAAAGSEPVSVELLGYNVYRDGQRLSSELLTAKSFVDEAPESFNHLYQVSAVYDKGESKACTGVNPGTEAVNALQNGNINVYSRNSEIVVKGATGLRISVSTLDGKLLSNCIATGDLTRIAATTGIYLVKVGTTTTKLIVK